MKQSILALMGLAMCHIAQAQETKLPAADVDQKTTTVMEALKTRHSVRTFASTKLTEQQLSNLCWAACGESRDSKHVTAPTAMNKQEIRLYVFSADGVYEYNAHKNTLTKKANGDHRNLMCGGQEFAKTAPVTLLMVIDFEKFGRQDDRALMMGCVDAGIVSENINLYCQSAGLATVPRATMDSEGIKQLLGLTDKQMPIINNPVGYEKK